MKIEGNNFEFVDTIQTPIAVPDCWVKGPNKLGGGHGEKKLYISSKEKMREFFGSEGFSVRCFMLRSDLLKYLEAIKGDYLNPSQDYYGKEKLPSLWGERLRKVQTLPEIIEFNIDDQAQIGGPRGYVNSDDEAFDIIREVSLPLVSYISTMHLRDGTADVFYWKLFADYEEMERRRDFIRRYGKKGEQPTDTPQSPTATETQTQEYRNARIGQGRYRERLLEECPFCPITFIQEESLLIASHIKPWAVADDRERTDPKNGFILSPLYDRLFDRGYITFGNDRRVHISNWLSRQDRGRIAIADNQLFQFLPIDEQRKRYLAFHRSAVFKG